MFLELESIGLEGQNFFSTRDVMLMLISHLHLSSSALFFCVYEHAKVKLLMCLKEPLEVNPYDLCTDDQRSLQTDIFQVLALVLLWSPRTSFLFIKLSNSNTSLMGIKVPFPLPFSPP